MAPEASQEALRTIKCITHSNGYKTSLINELLQNNGKSKALNIFYKGIRTSSNDKLKPFCKINFIRRTNSKVVVVVVVSKRKLH